MSKLSTAARKELPASKFAGPGRSFPIEDKVHAEKALQLEPRAEAAGHLTSEQGARVKRLAHAMLKKGK